MPSSCYYDTSLTFKILFQIQLSISFTSPLSMLSFIIRYIKEKVPLSDLSKYIYTERRWRVISSLSTRILAGPRPLPLPESLSSDQPQSGPPGLLLSWPSLATVLCFPLKSFPNVWLPCFAWGVHLVLLSWVSE